MDIVLIIAGFLLGWFSRIFYKYYKNLGKLKRSRLSSLGYKPTSFETIKDALRNIVIRYNKDNRDFLLNIKIPKSTGIQLLHRSHYPELSKSISDIYFGIAIYIPLKGLDLIQKDKLEKILKDEVQPLIFSEMYFSYYVIDIGTKIRYGGELLALILKEVFDVKVNDQIKVELYDGGKLPYNLIDFESFRAQ